MAGEWETMRSPDWISDKGFLHCLDSEIVEQIAQRGCTFSILGGFQDQLDKTLSNLTWAHIVHPALSKKLSRRLPIFFQTWIMLWYIQNTIKENKTNLFLIIKTIQIFWSNDNSCTILYSNILLIILAKKLGTLLTSHQLPCEISHFIKNMDNLGQQTRQMHYLEGRMHIDFSKDSWWDYFIHLSLSSKTQ